MSMLKKAPQSETPEVLGRLITVAEAAELAGVHHQTVRRWIIEGRLTGYRLGKRLLRVDRDELLTVVRVVPTVGMIGRL